MSSSVYIYICIYASVYCAGHTPHPACRLRGKILRKTEDGIASREAIGGFSSIIPHILTDTQNLLRQNTHKPLKKYTEKGSHLHLVNCGIIRQKDYILLGLDCFYA
jgi:hypothetical protein